jgi:phenylpropionate dioxygenase-like ring-hydroxylating dioxygenase large terminal subunit
VKPQLRPPATKEHVSVARLNRYWYVACASAELGKVPLGKVVLGVPLVVFRDDSGRAAALLDRCPHRNVPLSIGRVSKRGTLQCAYHGWEFDGSGVCRNIPGLLEATQRERAVTSYPVRERDGFVWVYPSEEAPVGEPFAVPLTNDGQYVSVYRTVTAPGTLHAAVENALDVPHTAFLHGGLFRTERPEHKKTDVTAIVRRAADRVEAEYVGEPRPEGAVVRLLSPSGGMVSHWDRFILPSVAQVEYRLGSENHFLVTALCTPESDFVTHLHAVVSFKLRVPAHWIKPLVEPLALRIFGQDAKMLRHQTETVQRFGGEQFMNTDIDVLGPEIWRLLKQAERGEVRPSELVSERRVTLRV